MKGLKIMNEVASKLEADSKMKPKKAKAPKPKDDMCPSCKRPLPESEPDGDETK